MYAVTEIGVSFYALKKDIGISVVFSNGYRDFSGTQYAVTDLGISIVRSNGNRDFHCTQKRIYGFQCYAVTHMRTSVVYSSAY